MLKLNTVFLGAILGTIGLGFSAPAVAQFEVAPDHFTDNAQEQPQAQTSKHEEVLNSRIRGLQSELDGYRWQIKQRASALETARRLASGVGGEGEFASLFIDEYIQRSHELEQLQHDLAPLIHLAQSELNQLTSAQAANAPPKHATAKNNEKQRPVLLSGSLARQQRQLAALAHR